MTDGSVSKLDAENLSIRLLSDVVLLLNWPAQEGSNEVLGLVCDRGAPVNCILVLVAAWKLSTNFGNEVSWQRT